MTLKPAASSHEPNLRSQQQQVTLSKSTMSPEVTKRWTSDSHYDVIVIGAGCAGLPAAKNYLQIDPSTSLLLIDANRSIGGVWAKENLYPSLKTNNLLGTYEFPDFPMHEGFGMKKGEHISGAVCHEYLRQYAEKFDLVKRTLLETKVKTVERIEKGWNLTLQLTKDDGRDGLKQATRLVTCTKLMVATGLTNLPAPIDILGSESFQSPIINFASFGVEFPTLLNDPSIKQVTVIGTGKAAYDSVYLLATSGKRVTWILRKSGHGPAYMSPPYMWIGPFYCWIEMVASLRPFTFLSPCIWGNADGFGRLRSLLHESRMGRWIVKNVWKKLGSDILEQGGLNKHEKLTVLKPEAGVLWYASGTAILNYPTNFYDLIISGQVEVLRKDIERLEGGNRIKFTDGTTIETNALLSSNGWKFTPDIEFLPRSLYLELGLPTTEYTKTQRDIWDNLNARADVEILERFPLLAKRPRLNDDPLAVGTNLPEDNTPLERKECMPWRLWRGFAPPLSKEKNLVFLGMMANIQIAVRNDLAGIWAYAYMNGMLESQIRLSLNNIEGSLEKKPTKANPNGIPSEVVMNDHEAVMNDHEAEKMSDEDILYETALFNRFSLWRAPYGFGARYPDFAFDNIPFFDLLLRDLGLNPWRKGGWIREIFGGPYLPKDYLGVVDEWKIRKGLNH